MNAMAIGSAVLLAAVSGAARAQSAPSATEPKKVEFSGGPYCGIYCVFAALRAQGVNVRFEELLERKYVGSYSGSTLGELSAAVNDLGGQAQPMQGLTAGFLRASSNPVILHVRRPGKGMPYRHWVLFLGCDGDQARIVDPPYEVQHYSFADLLSLWDGVGLVVAKESANRWSGHVLAWLEFAALLLLVAAPMCLTRRLISSSQSRRCFPAAPALCVFATLAALLAHALHDDGFFRNRPAVAAVVGNHFTPSLPSVDVEAVAELANRGAATFVDARFPADFEYGHLPGAINLPIYAGLVERSRLLSAIPSDRRVIVYCQSEYCKWGEVIAADLHYRGYRNVALFPGGWVAWQEREARNAKRGD